MRFWQSFLMENDIFDTSLPVSDHNHGVFNAVTSHMFSSPFMQSGVIDHNMVDTHEQMIANNSMPSNVQEEFLNNLYIPNNCGRVLISEGNSGNIGCGTSLANLLPSDVGSGDNVFSINNSSTSALAMNMSLQDGCNLFHSSYPRNHDGSMVHPSYHVIGSNIPCWNLNDSNNYLLPRNELSLTLGSDHCSEKSCSVVTQVAPKDCEELSLFCGPSSSVHFSHVLLGSRYRDVVQEVLAEVVKYALDNYEELDDSMSGIEGETRNSFSSSCSRAKVFTEVSSLEFTSSGSREDVEHKMLEERQGEKTELLSMLQMVDHRYKQCSENIQNVIMAFHDATNSSGPQMLARFALHTFTSAFKKLREEIMNQILLFGQGWKRVKERAIEPSFIRKQWALQLGRKDQQSWRPQRGLPERSVAVLRAWMFQNFLHPYPKDNDKQLLAMQSGLTRSQVSNWFINARVRIWKPMIEEMYSEIKRRQPEEGVEGDFESHGNIGNRGP